jgi:hypothetical protein
VAQRKASERDIETRPERKYSKKAVKRKKCPKGARGYGARIDTVKVVTR